MDVLSSWGPAFGPYEPVVRVRQTREAWPRRDDCNRSSAPPSHSRQRIAPHRAMERREIAGKTVLLTYG